MNYSVNNTFKLSRAVTLIELVVVILILAILAIIASS
ncbi:prepilin-type N-terminal cleavage/methylation domain-containing protein [Shewanella glacialimarina]|nr:prepilin-type N-terminal cleavage/methylation domain-containing protein [Shewanella glacialimarina]